MTVVKSSVTRTVTKSQVLSLNQMKGGNRL
nr:MAG TPA: hypothetical protein [Bacteriophage sp.]